MNDNDAGMMPQQMTKMSYNGMEASKRLGLAKLHISIIWRAPGKINRVKSVARECDNNKMAWKPQELHKKRGPTGVGMWQLATSRQ
jgi:hypothetical protein